MTVRASLRVKVGALNSLPLYQFAKYGLAISPGVYSEFSTPLRIVNPAPHRQPRSASSTPRSLRAKDTEQQLLPPSPGSSTRRRRAARNEGRGWEGTCARGLGSDLLFALPLGVVPTPPPPPNAAARQRGTLRTSHRTPHALSTPPIVLLSHTSSITYHASSFVPLPHLPPLPPFRVSLSPEQVPHISELCLLLTIYYAGDGKEEETRDEWPEIGAD